MRIRSYRSHDASYVEKLFEGRGIPFDRELFHWKKNAPSVYSWVGEWEEQIVAHYSIIEMPFWEGMRVGFAVDAIFAAHMSRVPYIAKLLAHALQEVKRAGLAVVIGIPNERMKPVKRLLGWATAPFYQWNMSGDSCLQEAGMTEIQLIRSDLAYEQWRWEQAPRQYRVTENGNFVVSNQFYYEGQPWLMRVLKGNNSSNLFDDISRNGVSFLKKISSDLVLEAPNSLIVEPLFVCLKEGITSEELEWPLFWPLETLEGVTLGW